jgi:hypothetical protein
MNKNIVDAIIKARYNNVPKKKPFVGKAILPEYILDLIKYRKQLKSLIRKTDYRSFSFKIKIQQNQQNH